jgi:hypothetical protein
MGTSASLVRSGCIGFLEPGQKAFVSAGQFGTTAEPKTLELMHRGNLLSATQLTEVATAK